MANSANPQQSYLNFLINISRPQNISAKEINADKAVKGTCNSMCPKDEIILRKRERMVHVLELVGTEQKLVKCYCRPAADTNLAVAHHLRPFHMLKKTIDYLLFEVTKRKDVSNLVIYNFVADRLRAVRQDMIIQDFDPELRIVLLEPMIRFHIYYGYLLCEESITDYSPTLNKSFLLECLKTCLYCYDELELMDADKTNDMSLLINNMVNCNLGENGQQLGQNRELVEALYVLTNLYDESPMWRLGRLSEYIRHAPPVRLAYRLASAVLCGHYVTVCKMLPKLCPLMFCAAALLLPTLQRRGLQVVCVAYSSHGRGVPLHALCSWLGFADDAAASGAARRCGLAVANGLMACTRGTFRDDAPALPPRKLEAEHLKGKMTTEYILTYSPGNTYS